MIATRYNEAGRQRNVGDVRAPNLIRTVDRQPAQQVRVDPVSRLGVARTGLPVNRLQAHQVHHTTDPTPPHRHAFAPQVPRHLTAPVEAPQPIWRHHWRIDATANAGVSWSQPTLTQASLRAMS